MSIPKTHYFEAEPAVASRPPPRPPPPARPRPPRPGAPGAFRAPRPRARPRGPAAPPRPPPGAVAAPAAARGGARFAAISPTPPVRVGKAPLHALLEQWLPRLKPGGTAYLVVQRNLGSDSLAKWLSEQGYGVTRLKSKKGYRILEVRPPA